MKVKYVSADGRITFEFEGASHKDVFAKLAEIQDVFEVGQCGCCKAKQTKFDVREYDGNVYHKIVCLACGAQLDLGQTKVGNRLFVKRTEKESKRPMPNGGWYVYRKSETPAATEQNHDADTPY